MSINAINTEAGEFTYKHYHYSEVVKTGELVFFSGVVGSDAKGKVPKDINEEFHNVWKKIGEVLAVSELGFDSIVEYTSYHIGLNSHAKEFSAVRDTYINEPWPCWTAVGVTELAMPGAHVEIRIVATLK
ncbi:MAG: enamine deaminase RidA (YjgF/YER057c/UK114 family) [Oceanicoccus sp.]|jgi:enamine deaminase RidA (YjgF/YER057c/UK114 family)